MSAARTTSSPRPRVLCDEARTGWWLNFGASHADQSSEIAVAEVVYSRPLEGGVWPFVTDGLAWSAIAVALVATMAADLYYPLLYVGLVGLLRARVRHWHPSVWLDGLMVALCAAALGCGVRAGSRTPADRRDVAVVATNLAYPLGDLLLMSTAVAGVFLLARRLDVPWALLGAGVLADGVGDTVYLVQDSAGQYTEGTALDLTWLVGSTLIALASSWRTGFEPPSTEGEAAQPVERAVTSAAPAQTSRWGLLGVPAVVTVISLGLLVPVGGWQSPTVAQWIAAAALCVVAARTSLTYREVWQLADIRLHDDLTAYHHRTFADWEASASRRG